MWHCVVCIYFHSLTYKRKSVHFPTPAVIFLPARGTYFIRDLGKSIYGIFITSDDVWDRHKVGLKARVWEVQSILTVLHSRPWSYSPLLALQDQQLKMHSLVESVVKRWGGAGSRGGGYGHHFAVLPLLAHSLQFCLSEALREEVVHQESIAVMWEKAERSEL